LTDLQLAIRRRNTETPPACQQGGFMTADGATHAADMYRRMLLIRRFEEATAKAYAEGKILGFCHLYIGQEAVAVAAIDCLESDDLVFTSYRDHGHALAKGLSSRRLMAELYGRVDGCCKGLGGSMHMFDASKGMLGGYGIVGGHVPLAAGAGFTIRYQGEDKVVMCFMGEGAANQGVFFEAMQLSALWGLPVVYIIENNGYAMGTPLSKQTPVENISLKAVGFGMEHDRIEDTDVLALRARVQQAVDLARRSKAPTLLEVRTYRYRGHSMSDPAKYRTRDEVKAYKERDPLKLLGQRLTEHFGYTEEQLKDFDSQVAARVKQALDFAENSPWPGVDVALEAVYASGAVEA
jgi:pyruvate dehydrogenase E1 component alpha subunit